MNIFDKANQYINQAENSAVNFFSALAPWLAPVVPMQITISHMRGYLEFGWVTSISAGLVVEILGLAAVSTILRLWRHNQIHKADRNKQPIWIPVFVYCFYLVIILAIVALPEFAKDEQDWIAVFVKLLLSLLSVPAAITLAVRAQNTEIVTEIKEKKEGKLPRKVSEKLPNLPEKLPNKFQPTDWRKLPQDDRILIRGMEIKDIVRTYSIPERTARNWKKAALNGHVSRETF